MHSSAAPGQPASSHAGQPSTAAGTPALTLAEAWLVAIGDGRLSITDAADWAGARLQEGACADPKMHALAHCVRDGERKLHAWADAQPWRATLPQPYAFRAPVATLAGPGEAELHCLLPHEVLSNLFREVPRVFAELFGTPEERVAFWGELDRTAQEVTGPRGEEHRRWLQQHPCVLTPPAHRIPCGIHGDGGQMHGGEKITAVSWGGLCRRGPTADTRLLFMVLKDSLQLPGHATLYRCFEVLVWSFEALAKGFFPEKDELGRPFGSGHHPARAALAGQPLASPGPPGTPMCGAWCELRGDWLFLRDAMGFEHHYGARAMCHFCGARNEPGPLYYGSHFTDTGPLRQTLVGPRPGGLAGWASKDPISPLVRMPGFSVWRCMFDLMHTLELGILQKVIPAALQGLMGLPHGDSRRPEEPSVWEGRSKQAKCNAATLAYRAWASHAAVPSHSRVKRITPRWVSGKNPDISQEHAKAAALRAMLPWVAEVAETRRSSSTAAALRATLVTQLWALDRVYARQPRFLSSAQEGQAKAHCSAALQALAELCKLYPAGPWRLQPKAHALLHIAFDSALQNPRVLHCYQDEDFIGRTKRAYVACHGSTAPLRTIQRYALGTCTKLVAREELKTLKRAPKAPPPSGGPQRPHGAAPAALPKAAQPSPKRERGRPRKHTVARPQGRPRKPRQ